MEYDKPMSAIACEALESDKVNISRGIYWKKKTYYLLRIRHLP